jgi:glutamyl-tRNA(Gln) amidotransferase subunit E
MVTSSEIEDIIKKIVAEREDFIREQGDRSVGGLMGIVMQELRGKADGKTVKEILTIEVQKLLKA